MDMDGIEGFLAYMLALVLVLGVAVGGAYAVFNKTATPSTVPSQTSAPNNARPAPPQKKATAAPVSNRAAPTRQVHHKTRSPASSLDDIYAQAPTSTFREWSFSPRMSREPSVDR